MADRTVVLPKHIITAAKARVNPSTNVSKGSTISDNDVAFNYYNTAISDYRYNTNRTQLLRFLARTEGPLSTAVYNFVQMACNNYSVAAYDTGTNGYSQQGTNLANIILSRLNTLYDYTEGFSNKLSFQSLVETMIREAVLTNGVAIELVLDKARMPSYVQVIPLETITWVADNNNNPVPQQKVSTNDPSKSTVSLDIATFWVSRMIGDPSDLYPRSMMEAAIKVLVYFEEFMEDVRRVIKQSGHARQVVELDIDKCIATAPKEIQNDPTKLKTWLDNIQTGIQTQLQTIAPEDALIMYDTGKFSIVSPSIGTKIDYTPMLNVLSGISATSMKTPPSVLGMRLDGGTSTEGNIETLIFMKSAKGVQTPVETALSRMLTLACRLLGADIYVNFEFDSLDLRPEVELEAFYTMRQTRILQQLSLGFIGDDEAAMLLRSGPRPPGAPKLSGTMFMDGAASGSDSLPIRPGDTPIGKALQPDKKIPRKAGGAGQ